MDSRTSGTQRVLVIAKTYPELSSKYGETVCTAAVNESGEPLRLYPIPFRYLSGPQRFKRYQWISATLHKSQHDARPESYSVEKGSIVLQQKVPPSSDGWGKREEHVLKSPSWQHTSMLELLRLQREKGNSLAFIRPHEVTNVSIRKRDSSDAESFDQKLSMLRETNSAKRKQLDLFERTVPKAMKNLDYLGTRVCVDWRCTDAGCLGHSMQILDWEICELSRKSGSEEAAAKVRTLLDSDRYSSAFVLGNIHMYPASFAIIGLWYPPRSTWLF